jgi:hypothetical protein
LWFAHTMPNTGAAVFLQPGTGHSCGGSLLRVPLPVERAANDWGRSSPTRT